ncbi:MAG: biotin--[Clostridia bacterium]|nr:biotin--[acetyl-CoA-carboxylase] ligase [Clostridia bacterium]
MQKAGDYSRDSIRRELDRLGLSCVELSFFEEITSTNTEMKKNYLAGDLSENPSIFVARRQSAGRGRLGKSFCSPDAGIYMSLLLPGDFGGAKLTAYVAVMTSEAIEEISGIRTNIKWVNDVYASGRKLAGILCEGLVNPDSLRIEASVVGIGINVLKTDFPKEISDIAISLEEASGEKYSRAALIAHIAEKILGKMRELSEKELIEKYKSKSNVIGKTVKVTSGYESFFAEAVDINEKAELVVKKHTGETVVLNSGEISIKL